MYGIAVIETVIYTLVMTWMGFQTGYARRKYGVKYPTAYENKEDSIFNRYQRAHQNAVENATGFYVSLLIAALHQPIGAAIAGAIYIFGRVVYNLGYYKNPLTRRRGMFYCTFLSPLPLFFASNFSCFACFCRSFRSIIFTRRLRCIWC